jgi:hypothetical protein
MSEYTKPLPLAQIPGWQIGTPDLDSGQASQLAHQIYRHIAIICAEGAQATADGGGNAEEEELIAELSSSGYNQAGIINALEFRYMNNKELIFELIMDQLREFEFKHIKGGRHRRQVLDQLQHCFDDDFNLKELS